MSVKVCDGLRELELHFWWEPPRGAKRLQFHDRPTARAFLGRLHSAGNALALRRLVAAGVGASHLDDQALFEQLSWWVVTGKLRIVAIPTDPLPVWDGEEAEIAAAVPWNAPSPVEEIEALIEEPLPPPPVDGWAQAKALRDAARFGVAFCEECEKKKRSPRPKRRPFEDDEEADERAFTAGAGGIA